MSTVFASFKHLKLPISIDTPVTLPQIVYICMAAISPNSVSGASCWLTWPQGYKIVHAQPN